jgi:hypothetical protein
VGGSIWPGRVPNNHDKSFPIGIAFGSRVFVCDNLAFVGDRVIRRKHTSKAKRELPGLVTQIIEPLLEEWSASISRVHRRAITNSNTTGRID